MTSAQALASLRTGQQVDEVDTDAFWPPSLRGHVRASLKPPGPLAQSSLDQGNLPSWLVLGDGFEPARKHPGAVFHPAETVLRWLCSAAGVGLMGMWSPDGHLGRDGSTGVVSAARTSGHPGSPKEGPAQVLLQCDPSWH